MLGGCKCNNTNHTHLLYDCFETTFWEILLEYSLKYSWKKIRILFNLKKYILFIKVYVKNLAKNVIFKNNQIYLQVFLLFKSNRYNV